MHPVVQLRSRLAPAREPLWHPHVPEVVHVEADYPLPIKIGLLTQRGKEGILALPSRQDHGDLVLAPEQLPHLAGHSPGGAGTEIVFVPADDNRGSAIGRHGCSDSASSLRDGASLEVKRHSMEESS